MSSQHEIIDILTFLPLNTEKADSFFVARVDIFRLMFCSPLNDSNFV